MKKFECTVGEEPEVTSVAFVANDNCPARPVMLIDGKDVSNVPATRQNMKTMSWTVLYNLINEQFINILSETRGPVGLQVQMPDGTMTFCSNIRFEPQDQRVCIRVTENRSDMTIGALVKGLNPRGPTPFSVGDVPVIIIVNEGYGRRTYRTSGGIIGAVKPGLLFWRGTDILMRAGSVMTSASAPVDIVYENNQVP